MRQATFLLFHHPQRHLPCVRSVSKWNMIIRHVFLFWWTAAFISIFTFLSICDGLVQIQCVIVFEVWGTLKV